MIQGIDHEDNINADKTEVLLKANTASTLPNKTYQVPLLNQCLFYLQHQQKRILKLIKNSSIHEYEIKPIYLHCQLDFEKDLCLKIKMEDP